MSNNESDAKRPIRLFYSYSHQDEDLRLRLETHLAPMRWNRLIAEWHDRRIGAGDDWENEIDTNLETAEIILLLLSASFIASPYCWSKEMTKALERHGRREARVIPVILRPCRWTSTRLKVLQAVPKDARPVTLWTNEDEAFDDVAARIETVVEALQTAALDAAATPSPGAPAPPSPASGRGELKPLPLGEVGANAPGEGAGAPKLTLKNDVHIGVDPRELPDFAVFKDIGAPWCPEMVVIPAGTFLMGSPPGEADRIGVEGPQHRVTISRRFAIGRHAVTFDEYDHFCSVTRRQTPGDNGWGRGRRPVINVSWEDAQAYSAWLSGETGSDYRLPTEAEWEYACRAQTTTPFSFGATITPEQANYNGRFPYGSAKKGLYRGQTVPVGSLPANPWGLQEMHGNVWEWCHDGKRTYGGESVIDPLEPVNGSYCVLRGGSWDYPAHHVRSACRSGYDPCDRVGHFGFRCARVQEP
jgi:Uncharacterized conserved protein